MSDIVLGRPEDGFCRGLASHRWKLAALYPVAEAKTPRVEVVLYCDNCKSKRRDHVSEATGEVLSRGYEYRPGYRIKNPDGEKVGARKTAARAAYIKHLRKTGEVEKARKAELKSSK